MAAYVDNEIGVKEDSAFRKAFKFYKGRHKPLDFDQIIDVDNALANGHRIMKINTTYVDSKVDSEPNSGLLTDLHLTDPSTWKLYTFNDKHGLTLARNIFTHFGHYYWAHQCLTRYPARPNVSNIEREIRLKPDFDGNILRYDDLTRKLRWITLGYHHDWDTKVYNESNRSDMPENMQILASVVARHVLGSPAYKAEAAIVNFYHANSTLAGHVDRSERNMDAPLLSFSFGQSAIFLVGDSNPDVDPIALYLRSGDMIAMDKQVRLAYHAVPRIVSDYTFQSRNSDCNLNLDTNVIKYLNNNRINMNIRQVN